MPRTGRAGPGECDEFMSAGVIAGRVVAGVWSDRAGSGRLLVPGVAACAAGKGLFALATGDLPGPVWLALVSAVAYVLGFGALRNDSLVAIFRRSGSQGHGMASTAWNTAYDAGTAVGPSPWGLPSRPASGYEGRGRRCVRGRGGG